MTEFDQLVFAELRDDPVALGYPPLIAANNDEGIANVCNGATVQVVGLITCANLNSWAAETNMAAVIVDEAADAQSLLRSSALAIINVMQDANAGIDMAEQKHVDMLNAWETAGKLSAPNKASFLAYATRTIPRPVALFGKLLTANDVARVVRDDLGNPLIGA
ncbi:hypothetical protein [Nitrosovibrio sp. Nv6]|uniref:hypothetical protein n=1 Tax=Nitrosovibrio sp. Nv6 TaxID=1855340 RepID=UPI0008AC1255|nr:hypothetical protein [Nitrosovibrio sp. Nv6]SEO63812.1 hypothetical protein SAMN05216316_0679 [Nitrosovibrio sp. Nv6]